MRIYNEASLRNQFDLMRTSAAISRSLERLSSGKRVNSPQDDPAAYSMGLGFSNQIRGLTQANLNTNQAIGMLQTADTGMETQLDILQRMREISIEAANGSLTSTDRSNLNKELQALLEEYRRIASETDFNGTKLLDGTFSTKSIQIGADSGDALSLFVGSGKAADIFRKTTGTGNFKTRTTAAAGTGPYAMAVADANGDGKLDLFTTENGAASSMGVVSFFAGTGAGSFQNRVTYAVGVNPTSITVKDVTGDGIVDIISADRADNTISILKGNGDGTFQTRTTLAAGSLLTAVEVADFNNDGKMDIITAESYSTGGSSLFLGNGDGTFQSRVTFLTSIGSGLAVGDFNGDNKLDFAVSNSTSAGVTTYFGNGAGSFTIGSTLTTGTTTTGIVSGDINNDGYIDLLVTNSGTANVSVLLNNGTGNFTNGTTVSFSAGVATSDIKLGDLNNDGNLDIVVTQSASAGVGVLLGYGNGTFVAATTQTAGNGVNEAVLGDFNSDGVLDIAAADYSSGSGTTMSILLAYTQDITGEGDVSVLTQTKAQSLIKIVDTAISNITTKRSNIAALHNRLETTLAANLLMMENYDEALSQTIDADIAMETADLVKNQVLQQAQIAVASQANLQLQTVMGLLRF